MMKDATRSNTDMHTTAEGMMTMTTDPAGQD